MGNVQSKEFILGNDCRGNIFGVLFPLNNAGSYLGIYMARASVNIVFVEPVNDGIPPRNCDACHSIFVNNQMNTKESVISRIY